MGSYWAYVNNDYKWYCCKYVNGVIKIRLGPFDKQEEAQEAVEEYENSNK